MKERAVLARTSSTPAPPLADGSTGDGAHITETTTTQIAASREYEQYEGPIPHPQHLAELAKIDASLVDRVVKMAEAEQSHRHGLQNHMVTADTRLSGLGQIYGLIAVLAALLVVAYGYNRGLGGPATALGCAVIVALAGGFAVRQVVRRQPDRGKDKESKDTDTNVGSPDKKSANQLPPANASKSKSRR